MPLSEAVRLALRSILSSKLRSFFTLLGIIVSVGFLVIVVAIIEGMNAYVKDNLTAAMIGSNSFQVRRSPIAVGLLADEEVKAIAKRPLLTAEDAEAVRRALPDAQAVSLQSGWPTPVSDISSGSNMVTSVLVFGVTAPYQLVQDYRFEYGSPLTEPDVRERRYVAVLGYDIADKLFSQPGQAVGRKIRVAGTELTVRGVIAK
jgi:putative ABC transport system permease protein